MIIGNLYRLKEEVKNNRRKAQERYPVKYGITRLGINFWLDTEKRSIYIPFETLIVPLEIHSTTVGGRPLIGENSKRVIALLSTGEIATTHLDISEWEEVI